MGRFTGKPAALKDSISPPVNLSPCPAPRTVTQDAGGLGAMKPCAMKTLVALLSLFLLELQVPLRAGRANTGSQKESDWARQFPQCGGKKQSPINIRSNKVKFNPNLKPLVLNGYETHQGPFIVTNMNHKLHILLPQTMRVNISNGQEYAAWQMHFYWGNYSSEISGSEHTVDGKRHVGEVQVIHYNTNYNNFQEAQNTPDGLLMLAALFEVKEYSENTYYSDFINHLKYIKYPGQSTILNSIDVRDMLPPDVRHYYTYQGSLTTPPCTENVLWFLLKDPIIISRAQIVKLENSLLDSQNQTLHNAYRMTQPLNGRTVETNFIPLGDPSKALSPPPHLRVLSPVCSAMKTLVALLSLFLLELQVPLQAGRANTGSQKENDWAKEFPQCGGKKQSPINIRSNKVKFNPKLKHLVLNGYETHKGPFIVTNMNRKCA
ncbi:carbonic anhydrase 6-like [Suncus etruscus]|uniref:carbonic anhydrase 6-like n=1 Tax=Suncus etruscus TaxID=109475 RepID=UPI002110B765|nr:carbonic anhydrase 6-like [Suncus etruscus]